MPLPSPARRTPRVLHITVSETLIRAGSGFAVDIAVSLTVAGDWRGGTIRAGIDSGPMDTVAEMTSGATRASWHVPPQGALTISARPGTGAAPTGVPLTITYAIQGKTRPPERPVTSSSTSSATVPGACAGPRPPMPTSPGWSSVTPRPRWAEPRPPGTG